MADFSNFKIGNTSYKVKDAEAARDITLAGSPGLNQGKVQLTKANGQAIGNGITIDINDNTSIDHTYIDSQTLADGDVLTWDANGQSWQNKPASGGGGDAGFYPLINIDRSSWNNPSGYFSAILNLAVIPFTDNIGFNISNNSPLQYLGVRADAVIINKQWQNVETYLSTQPTLGDSVTLDIFKWHSQTQGWFWIRVNATVGSNGFGLTGVGNHGFNGTMDPNILP